MSLNNIIQENIDKLNWKYLSKNPNAIHLLEENLDKIDWNELSLNTNENLWNENIYVLK